MQGTTQFEYLVSLVRVIDGDTIIVNIPIGFGLCLWEANIRLHGINAPEIYGNEKMRGVITKQYLNNLLKDRQLKITVFHREFDKYGRILATVHAAISSTQWLNINEEMINAGHATKAHYVRGKYVSDKPKTK